MRSARRSVAGTAVLSVPCCHHHLTSRCGPTAAAVLRAILPTVCSLQRTADLVTILPGAGLADHGLPNRGGRVRQPGTHGPEPDDPRRPRLQSGNRVHRRVSGTVAASGASPRTSSRCSASRSGNSWLPILPAHPSQAPPDSTDTPPITAAPARAADTHSPRTDRIHGYRMTTRTATRRRRPRPVGFASRRAVRVHLPGRDDVRLTTQPRLRSPVNQPPPKARFPPGRGLDPTTRPPRGGASIGFHPCPCRNRSRPARGSLRFRPDCPGPMFRRSSCRDSPATRSSG